MKIFLCILLISFASQADERAPFRSLLKLKIHEKVQEIRKNQDAYHTFIMETFVHKVKVDAAIVLKEKGFTPEDRKEILESPEFKGLYDRIRNNPTLNQRTEAFLDQLTEPHYLENRVMQKRGQIHDAFVQELEAQSAQNVMQAHHKIRAVKTPPPVELSFWDKVRQWVLNF